MIEFFQKALLFGFLALNLVAFCVCAWDKFCAKTGRWRVPERTLMTFAAAFGSVGILLGMLAFHHKVRKPKFYLGVPALLILQVVLLVWIIA